MNENDIFDVTIYDLSISFNKKNNQISCVNF